MEDLKKKIKNTLAEDWVPGSESKSKDQDQGVEVGSAKEKHTQMFFFSGEGIISWKWVTSVLKK